MNARVTAEAGIAMLLAAALVAAAVVFGGTESGTAELRTSTYLDDRRGARALYLLLEQVGMSPQRRLEPPAADLPTGVTLVMAAPSHAVTPNEAKDLLDWTARGGRLVVVDAPSNPPQHVVDCGPLLAPAGLATGPIAATPTGVTVAEGLRRPDFRGLAWPARIVVEAGPDDRRDGRAGAKEDLVTSAQGALVARVPFGTGEIVCIADERLVSNEYLRGGDNAVLAVDLIAGDGSRPIVFDEFHHGFGDAAGDGVTARLFAMLPGTWPGRALLVLALAAVVYVAGAGVRFGAPAPEPRARRRAISEHADALGRLLERAGARPEALDILVEGVRRRSGPRAGVPAGLGTAAFRERLARSAAAGAPELAAALEAAESAARRGVSKDVEFTALAARVAAAQRRFLDG